MICKAIAVVVLIAVIGMCGLELWKISSLYNEEARIKNDLARYHPALWKEDETSIDSPEYLAAPKSATGTPAADMSAADMSAAVMSAIASAEGYGRPLIYRERANSSIADMQTEVNPDVVGWLTIPRTNIDYPFVYSEDNEFYLSRNIYKQQALAGSIFLDSRCSKDFTDLNTVIYGHNMKNRSMFGHIRLFADPATFDSIKTGTLYYKNDTYALEVFAYMVVAADDKMIYDISPDREELLTYVRKNARLYREPPAAGRIVTLSTCAYEFDGARMVLFLAADR